MRQIESEKLKLILTLKEIPVVILACKKVGLDKSTFYRWKNSDKRFAREVTRAMSRGCDYISDIAEAHVIQGVKKGEKNYVITWLKSHRAPYKRAEKTTVEIKQKIEKTMSKENKRKDGVLLPSISTDVLPMSPEFEKVAMKSLFKIFRDAEKEENIIKELAKKGWSGEEINEFIKKITPTKRKINKTEDTLPDYSN